jgi:hypothetical protein
MKKHNTDYSWWCNMFIEGKVNTTVNHQHYDNITFTRGKIHGFYSLYNYISKLLNNASSGKDWNRLGRVSWLPDSTLHQYYHLAYSLATPTTESVKENHGTQVTTGGKWGKHADGRYLLCERAWENKCLVIGMVNGASRFCHQHKARLSWLM